MCCGETQPSSEHRSYILILAPDRTATEAPDHDDILTSRFLDPPPKLQASAAPTSHRKRAAAVSEATVSSRSGMSAVARVLSIGRAINGYAVQAPRTYMGRAAKISVRWR